jgi:3-oxocholest-4-en-26-oyl-CoA dehydrogenase beta subunit
MHETDSPEQAALREAVRGFCRHHADGAWNRLSGELGLTGLAIDERYGGMGAGVAEVAVAAEELGRVLLPVPYLSTALAGAVLSEGDPGVAAGLLSGLASGALTAGFVFTGDIAVADGRLSGTASHVLDGGEAGVFLVRADGQLYAVRAADATVTAAGTLDQTRSQATVTFRDSPALVTGADGDRAEELMRVLLAAESVAAAEHCLDVTVAHLKSRQQFGRPIGAFQAVAQRLADGYVDVEAVRLSMWQAAWRLAAGLSCETEIATAKFWAADAGHRIAHTAVHVHGGVGIDLSYPVQRYFVAAKAGEFALGGATTQLRRIGALLASEG